MHTVTTDSAKICFNICMHMKVSWEPSKMKEKFWLFWKKLVAISHKKIYLPCLSCVWKKCVFKVKNVSLVSLHLFYYLSDILLLLWFHPYYMKYYSIKCWKYLRKNFPVVYFEEKRDCSENEYPIMFVALLILLYQYYNTYISKSSEYVPAFFYLLFEWKLF